ncbi:Multidrug resistance-associated protein 1 [Cichlidogyrus casuarinus]|uniref:Multidrug resistance-associated protein 1 n=1 Tax=Cichlidogyrus casuarinus TaxID=1844966 RepID=A0ABD2QFC1_9PLAT
MSPVRDLFSFCIARGTCHSNKRNLCSALYIHRSLRGGGQLFLTPEKNRSKAKSPLELIRRRLARSTKNSEATGVGAGGGGNEINLESGLQEPSQSPNAIPCCQVCQKACQHCSQSSKGPAEEKGKLVKEETVDTGRVKFTVFLAYIRNVGLVKCLAIILMYLTSQMASLGVALWLSDWSDDTDDKVKTPTRVGIHALLAMFQCESIFRLKSPIHFTCVMTKRSYTNK